MLSGTFSVCGGVLLQSLFIIEGKVLTSVVQFMNVIIHRLESSSHRPSVGLVIKSNRRNRVGGDSGL